MCVTVSALRGSWLSIDDENASCAPASLKWKDRGMGQTVQRKNCPVCKKLLAMALPSNGAGPRIPRCIECDSLVDARTMRWINSSLMPPTDTDSS